MDAEQDFNSVEEDAEIAEQFRDLLEHFIVDRFECDKAENAPGLQELRRGRVPPKHREELWRKGVKEGLREMGDFCDGDEKLAR